MKTYRYQTGELYCQQPFGVSDRGVHYLRRVREVLTGLESDRGEGGFIEGCLVQTEMLRIQSRIREEFQRLAFPNLFECFA